MDKERKNGDLRVWWISQIPMSTFTIPVEDLKQASFLLDVLANYDKFQYENNIKPDYSNAGGLSIWDENFFDEDTGECWAEWEDEESGESFDEYRRREL